MNLERGLIELLHVLEGREQSLVFGRRQEVGAHRGTARGRDALVLEGKLIARLALEGLDADLVSAVAIGLGGGQERGLVAEEAGVPRPLADQDIGELS